MPIRPELDPKLLGIKTPFSKKYSKFENNNYGQISITGPDLYPEKNIKIWRPAWSSNFTFFTKKVLKSLFLTVFLNIQKPSLFHFSFYTIINTRLLIIIKKKIFNYKKIFHLSDPRVLNHILKNFKKIKPGLDQLNLNPSHLGSSPGLISKIIACTVKKNCGVVTTP